MQPFDPTETYTNDQVRAALRGATGTRSWSFRYELLNPGNDPLRDLDGVLSGSVSYNALADIPRSASFTLDDAEVIDYLDHRIRPWARLRMPDGGHVEWPQGVFLLTTPTRTLKAGTVTREVEGYDQNQVLADDKLVQRLTVLQGELYTNVIEGLVSHIPRVYVAPSTKLVPNDREWEPGTSLLSIINDLLASINYVPAHFNGMGDFIGKPYETAAARPAEYTFATDQHSLILDGVDQTIDIFSVPNRWVLCKSDPDGPEMIGFYENQDPDNLTSIPSRGRVITDFRQETEAADQATITALAERLGYEASQVFEVVELSTALFPLAGHADVYRFELDDLAVSDKYTAHTWEMDLAAGASMSHSVRRVVSLA